MFVCADGQATKCAKFKQTRKSKLKNFAFQILRLKNCYT
jgi:hypothetical protein